MRQGAERESRLFRLLLASLDCTRCFRDPRSPLESRPGALSIIKWIWCSPRQPGCSRLQKPLYPAGVDQSCKMFKRAVVSGLGIIREAASGQFPHPEVIDQTLTANAFFTARFVRAIAPQQILFLSAFHKTFPPPPKFAVKHGLLFGML